MATGGLSSNNVQQTLDNELIRVLEVLGLFLGLLFEGGGNLSLTSNLPTNYVTERSMLPADAAATAVLRTPVVQDYLAQAASISDPSARLMYPWLLASEV